MPDSDGVRTDRSGKPPGARRELVAAVAVLMAGGAVALLAAQPTWVHVSAGAGAAVGAGVALSVDVPGTQAAPLVVPLSLLALAGALGVVATHRTARRVVGAVLALAGAGLVLAAALVPAGPRTAAAGALERQSVDRAAAAAATYAVSWWWLCLAASGGLAVLAGAAATLARGGRWPAMGARYEAPVGRAASTGRPVDAWTALDRGDDPTLDDPVRTGEPVRAEEPTPVDVRTDEVPGAGEVPE